MGGDVALSCHISANPIVASRVGKYLSSGISGSRQRPSRDRSTEQRPLLLSLCHVAHWSVMVVGGRGLRAMAATPLSCATILSLLCLSMPRLSSHAIANPVPSSRLGTDPDLL